MWRILTDNRLKAISSYLKPSVGGAFIGSIFLVFAIFAIFASIFILVEGEGEGLLAQMFFGSILFFVFGFLMLRKYRNALDEATSYVSYMASKYGHDALYNDFCKARDCGTFRLGQHFLYSKHANTIMSYSEISSVHVSRESNFDGPPDDLIVCVRNGISSIDIGYFIDPDSASYVSEIKARIEATQSKNQPSSSPEKHY